MPQVHILSCKNNDNLLDIFSLELYGQTLINEKDIPIHVYFKVLQYFLAINDSNSSLIEEVTIDSLIGAYKSNDFISKEDAKTDEYYLQLKRNLWDFPEKIRSVIELDMIIAEKRDRVRRSEEIIKKMRHFFDKNVEIVIDLLTYCDPEVASKEVVEFILASKYGFSSFLASLEDIIKETSFRSKGRLAYENVEQIITEIQKALEEAQLSQLDKFIWTLSLLGRSANEDIPKIPDVMNIIINKGVFGGG